MAYRASTMSLAPIQPYPNVYISHIFTNNGERNPSTTYQSLSLTALSSILTKNLLNKKCPCLHNRCNRCFGVFSMTKTEYLRYMNALSKSLKQNSELTRGYHATYFYPGIVPIYNSGVIKHVLSCLEIYGFISSYAINLVAQLLKVWAVTSNGVIYSYVSLIVMS